MFQRRLVVGCHKPQIAAVLLGLLEAEIADMQSQQHRARADRIADAGSCRAGVDRDLLAKQPLAVPPSPSRRRSDKERQQRQDEE